MDQITGKDTESSAWPQGISAITLFVEDLAAARPDLALFSPSTWKT
jgi:hypothetical protein